MKKDIDGKASTELVASHYSEWEKAEERESGEHEKMQSDLGEIMKAVFQMEGYLERAVEK